MGSVRRRQLMGSSGGPDEVSGYIIPGNVKKGDSIKVEYPDCVRLDLYKSSVGNVTMGYFLYEYVDYVILDGSRVSFTGDSASGIVISNVSVGFHIIYIHVYKQMPSNYNFIINNSLSYCRIPYTANLISAITGSFWGQKFNIVDVLYNKYIPFIKNDSVGIFSNADIIRVPVGAKQKYVDNSVKSAITSKMIEVNFKYKI